MTELPDRPSTLKRAPRPAVDESTDPIDYIAPGGEGAVTALGSVPNRASAEAPQVERQRPAFQPANGKGSVDTSSVRRERPGRPSNREITSPFSTQLALDVLDLIDAAKYDKGISKRAVVEEAIRKTFGHLAD